MAKTLHTFAALVWVATAFTWAAAASHVRADPKTDRDYRIVPASSTPKKLPDGPLTTTPASEPKTPARDEPVRLPVVLYVAKDAGQAKAAAPIAAPAPSAVTGASACRDCCESCGSCGDSWVCGPPGRVWLRGEY